MWAGTNREATQDRQATCCCAAPGIVPIKGDPSRSRCFVPELELHHAPMERHPRHRQPDIACQRLRVHCLRIPVEHPDPIGRETGGLPGEVRRHPGDRRVYASRRAAGRAYGVSDVVVGRILRGEHAPAEPVDDAIHAHVLVALFLLTGCRFREVAGLELDDVSFDRRTITGRPKRWRALKTRTSHRVIPLWPQLEAILRAWVFGPRLDRGGSLLVPSWTPRGEERRGGSGTSTGCSTGWRSAPGSPPATSGRRPSATRTAPPDCKRLTAVPLSRPTR